MIEQRLSHYRILKKLGAGGMGEVYLAEDERLGRKVALKILPEAYMQDELRVRRFEQEARSASGLNHPGILTIFDIGRTADTHFIATEFIEGETLRDAIAGRKLTLSDALEIAIQTASALAAAHNAGIIHRDIKPENIMLRPDGYIKVLDFGLAKLTETDTAERNENLVNTRSMFQTQPGLVIGTVAYMSPEQARGQKLDGRTDLFSLGVVLYELITGERPFAGPTTSDTIAALLTSLPPRPSERIPGIPAELEEVIYKLLAKNRDERYQYGHEVITALKRIKSRLEYSLEHGVPATSSDPAAHLETAYFEGPAGSAGLDTVLMPASGQQVSYETSAIPSAADPVQTVVTPMPQPQPLPQAEPRKKRKLLLPALAVLLLGLTAAGALFYARYQQQAARIDTIAVLPFVNVTGDPDAEYLCEGITEGIINSLSQWDDLSISARNSVFRYKGQQIDERAVGRDLDVEAVLLGRIERRGNTLTINAELVNTRNGRQIWGERFNKKLSDLLTIQDEIARSITGKLEFRLSDAAAQSLAKSMPNSSEAYDLFLKGRYHWNLGSREDRQRADEYFEAAFAKDPSYSLAAAGCAACHALNSDGLPPRKGMQKAKAVALVALGKNSDLPDAHLTLAQVYLRYDWNLTEAEREFKRAIELAPKNATSRVRYAEFLALLGKTAEANAELQAARKLDPKSLPVNQTFGTVSYYARDYNDAVDHLRQTLLLNDNYGPAHSSLGLVLEQKGQPQDAILEFIRAKQLGREAPERVNALKTAYSKGQEEFWRVYLAQLTAESKERYVPSTAIAAVLLRIGEQNKALAALEAAVAERDGGLMELHVEPAFDPLRKHPRFQQVLARVGLAN
jgi:serine/threonine protein kinase/TolB-like protein/Tfp pilus assembly protein PilF